MKQVGKVKRWLNGPHFLHAKVETQMNDVPDIDDDDPEVVKRVHVCEVVDNDLLCILETRISRWLKMKRVMAMIVLFIKKLRKTPRLPEPERLSVEDLEEAEIHILKMAQRKYFKKELVELTMTGETGNNVFGSSKRSKRKVSQL